MGMANAGKEHFVECSLRTQRSNDIGTSGNDLRFCRDTRWRAIRSIDTPGLTRNDSLLTHVPDALLKTIIPFRTLKPRVFQLYENQSYALGGMVRLDVMVRGEATVVAYFSEQLKIHRGKQAKADALWEKHLGELLAPSLDHDFHQMKRFDCVKKEAKMDVVHTWTRLVLHQRGHPGSACICQCRYQCNI